MIITISGFIGSGKTTVAKALSRRFGLRHISAGGVFRAMAKEKGLTLEEFTKLAEEDPGIDREVDARQMEMAKRDDSVIDGRLSGWLVDADIKIWLKAPLDIRAKRVAKRESKEYGRALQETRNREESEIRRYRELYNIDMQDLTPYNVIIDTTLWNAREVADIIGSVLSLNGVK